MSDRQKTRINIGRNACLFNAKKSENNCCAFVGMCGKFLSSGRDDLGCETKWRME
jgi:hypothetical protein